MSGVVRCKLCPKECELAPGQRGDCRARVNLDGKLVTLVYGKPCAARPDPVEKKPMFHFLPGTRIFSIATAGCNLHCKFCQNWDISQKNPEDARNIDMPPQKVVQAARGYSCLSVAYTYSEPLTFYEYTRDTCVLAKKAGLKNVIVTAGYINEEPLRELCESVDGANVDLKAFTEEYYRDMCDGDLATVLRSLRIMREEGVFIEITNLVLPGHNDDPTLIKEMCEWIKDNLGARTPIHFSRFHPQYRMMHLYPTPAKTLQTARDVAKETGLHHVYVGNVPGVDEDTYCPRCGKTVISRIGYRVTSYKLDDGRCSYCGTPIAGVWK